jgi:hypothetical protein
MGKPYERGGKVFRESESVFAPGSGPDRSKEPVRKSPVVSENVRQKYTGNPKKCRILLPSLILSFNGMARFVPGFTGGFRITPPL